MRDGPHTYGQCRFCTEYHFTYPAKKSTVNIAMMENALAAIVVLHHKDEKHLVNFSDLHPDTKGWSDGPWGNPCCECDQQWPCSTRDIAARALGFEQIEEIQ